MVKIIINKLRRVTIGKGISILYDLKYNDDQLIKLIEDMLLSKSIIAEEIRVFK